MTNPSFLDMLSLHMPKKHRGIEAKFLEVDKKKLKEKLMAFGAKDCGGEFFRETIFYDKAQTLRKRGDGRFIRIRKSKDQISLTYKHHQKSTVDGTEEIESTISDAKTAEKFLDRLGFVIYRIQEKKRHRYRVKGVSVDIDTWPKIPTYVELEGESATDLKKAAKLLGLDWSKAVFANAGRVIEDYYHFPLGDRFYFTFKKIS